MNNNYKFVFNLLPSELKPEDNAKNIKKLLNIYGNVCDVGDNLNIKYSEIIDIYKATDTELDMLGGMFAVYRITGEEDEAYRDRIIREIINRKTPTTLPEIQQAIDSIVEGGKLDIKENYNNRVCNVYLTGTANYKSIVKALNLSKAFLPAGVYVIVPVVSFKIWQSIKDQFDTWQSLMDRDYIW